MQKKVILRVLSYFAFVITSVFTALLMLTSANTLLEQVLSVGMAVVMQASSFIFMQLYVSEKKRFYAALSGVLFLISIFATLCLQVNQLNILQNEALVQSDEYKRGEEAKKLTAENRAINISLLDEKKNEKADLEKQLEERINSVKASFENKINTLEQQKNALPRDYLTQRKNVDSKIIKEQNNLQKELGKITEENIKLLESKSKELDTVSDKINAVATVGTVPSTIVSNKKIEKGFLGFVTMIETWNLGTREILILVIGVILATAFELTAIALYVASNNIVEGKKKLILEDKPKEIAPTPPVIKDIKKKSTATENKVKIREVEVKIEDDEITDLDIQKYLKVARKTATESGRCIGYKKIGELAGIKNAYKIYNHLRAKGIIKIENNNAYIERIRKDEKLA